MPSTRVLLLGLTLALVVAVGWMLFGRPSQRSESIGVVRLGVHVPESRASDGPLEPVDSVEGDDTERSEAEPASIDDAPMEVEEPLAPSAPAPALPVEEAAEPDQSLPLVGPVTGRLIPESGLFGGDSSALLRGITIDLVSRTTPRVEARATLVPVYDEDGGLTEITFATEDLPALEFEVTLASLDHRRWAPVAQSVVPPASEVTFLCYDADQFVELDFIVTDAETGEPVDDWSATRFRSQPSNGNGVLLQAGPLETDAFPLDARLLWTIEASDYAAAFGDERSFSLNADTGKWTAHVELERGFAARIVVLGKSPDRVLANGATIRLDGEFSGRTGASGVVEVRRDEAPETISVHWGTQSLEGAFAEVCLSRRGQLYVALLDESGG